MDKQSKNTIITVSAVFAVVIILMLLLIPVELKRLKIEKYGELAEAAETDERAEFIIENYDEYPEYILEIFYNDPENQENLDFVYNYFFNKDNYKLMIYTDEELNSDDVPALYMHDTRWGYERIGDSTSIIKTDGCAYVCITMAYLSLTGKSDVDPVALADFSYYNGLSGTVSNGLKIKNIGDLCSAIGLKGEYYNFDPDEGGTPIETATQISELLSDESVILAAMQGDTFGGHAIIIRDCQGENIYINDPESEEKTSVTWNFNDIKSEIMALWVISE